MSSLPCDRRCFLASTVLAPAVAMSAAAELAAKTHEQQPPPEPPPPATGVRITVLKRTQELVLQQKYVKQGVIPACGVVRDGQQFVAQPPYSTMPGGMCDSAWRHMRDSVSFVHGGSVDQLVVCCTDGYRPVFFLLERLV